MVFSIFQAGCSTTKKQYSAGLQNSQLDLVSWFDTSSRCAAVYKKGDFFYHIRIERSAEYSYIYDSKNYLLSPLMRIKGNRCSDLSTGTYKYSPHTVDDYQSILFVRTEGGRKQLKEGLGDNFIKIRLRSDRGGGNGRALSTPDKYFSIFKVLKKDLDFQGMIQVMEGNSLSDDGVPIALFETYAEQRASQKKRDQDEALHKKIEKIKHKENQRRLEDIRLSNLAHSKWENRMSDNKQVGDKVCTYEGNLFGFVDLVSGSKVKLQVLGKVTGQNPGYFFSGKYGSYNYADKNSIIWIDLNKVAHCDFNEQL